MKILSITAFPPCGNGGGERFTLNAIREISEKHEIDVIYFEFPGHKCELDENDKAKVIAHFPASNKNAFRHPFVHPLFSRRFNKKILSYIRRISSKYDALYFDFSQTAIYSLFINHPCKIIRMHDVIFQKYSRKNKFFGNWAAKTENKIVHSCNCLLVLSEKDAEIVKQKYDVTAFWTHEYLRNYLPDNNLLVKKN